MTDVAAVPEKRDYERALEQLRSIGYSDLADSLAYEIKRLRQVLNFYASQMGQSGSKDRRIITQDCGRRARECLEKPK